MLRNSGYVTWRASQADVRPHPTLVCEPINLAAAEQPKLTYNLQKPTATTLSTLQTETIQRAMQSFDARRAFLIGDATGVGKGRTIAGLIAEVCHKDANARVAWISANMRLESDARAELSIVDGPVFEDVIRFSSYTALQNAQRADEIFEWLRSSTFPLLVLDECHSLRNAKGIVPRALEALMCRLESECTLRTLYSSATACSLPRHMTYLGRLGLFGTPESPFSTADELVKTVRGHGASLMELMAIDLRSRGAYVARQLSFDRVKVSHETIELTNQQQSVYDACGQALRDVEVFGGSSHQAFFQRLVTAFKADAAIALVEKHTAAGSSVVISLVSTGEASLRRHGDTPQPIGEDLLAQYGVNTVDDLPMNPLDKLVTHFGEKRIAELTGRRVRPLRSGTQWRLHKTPNIHDEATAFRRGEKHIAVLSRAGGTGISLHDVDDGRPRVHVILEIPWSAEDLLQQMGRTHRSSSRHSPHYILVTSNVPAETRFASSIVQKLQSFGALVKGDRSSCTFSFLKVPRWSPAARRSIGLYLATGAKLRDDMTVPRMTRLQALGVCQGDAYSGESALKTRFTQMLHQDVGDSATVIGAAARLFPNDITMLLHRWTPQVHSKFPSAFRSQVVALLLCAQAWETQRSLGILSKDLLLYIVALMACPVTREDARLTARRFCEHNLHDMGTLSMEMILNRMLGMEIAVQRNVFLIADALVQPERPPASACFTHFVEERAGHGIQSDISDITHTSYGDGVTGVRVEVVYTTRSPASPPHSAIFWRHIKSGRTCWVNGDRLVFHDCTETQMRYDESLMRSRDYFPAALADWRSAVRRMAQSSERRARRLPRSFHLATLHALRLWKNSAHRVLRVPPTTLFPQGIVGLLLFTSA